MAAIRRSSVSPAVTGSHRPEGVVIIDARHFVWEEEPAKYASAVLGSIMGNWP